MDGPMSNTVQTVVSLTEIAARHIQEMLAKEPESAGKGLRVYIEQGGCSGLQYGMVFDQRRDGDLVGEHFGVAVVVDPTSAGYLRGAVVDFDESLTGGGFKIKNPNARESCGCGNSFATEAASPGV
jgi:iron-sulfur cluster assembly accessory protein